MHISSYLHMLTAFYMHVSSTYVCNVRISRDLEGINITCMHVACILSMHICNMSTVHFMYLHIFNAYFNKYSYTYAYNNRLCQNHHYGHKN